MLGLVERVELARFRQKWSFTNLEGGNSGEQDKTRVKTCFVVVTGYFTDRVQCGRRQL